MALSYSRQNWQGLQTIAHCFFKTERAGHANWSLEQLFDAHDLPRTAMLLDLASQAGFSTQEEPTTEEICAIIMQRNGGMHSAEDIERITKIGPTKIQRVLSLCAGGYGVAPFGCAPYGGNRAVSNGKTAVCRRITVKGQLSYRGQRYSLGALYRGRVVLVREREADLLITCKDRSPVHVTRYYSR